MRFKNEHLHRFRVTNDARIIRPKPMSKRGDRVVAGKKELIDSVAGPLATGMWQRTKSGRRVGAPSLTRRVGRVQDARTARPSENIRTDPGVDFNRCC